MALLGRTLRPSINGGDFTGFRLRAKLSLYILGTLVRVVSPLRVNATASTNVTATYTILSHAIAISRS